MSNHGNQVHLALGIKSDRRTKKLKSRPAKRRALALSQQQVLPVCLPAACLAGYLVRSGAPTWAWRVLGGSCPLRHSLLQPQPHRCAPPCPSHPASAPRVMKFTVRFVNEKHYIRAKHYLHFVSSEGLFCVNFIAACQRKEQGRESHANTQSCLTEILLMVSSFV